MDIAYVLVIFHGRIYTGIAHLSDVNPRLIVDSDEIRHGFPFQEYAGPVFTEIVHLDIKLVEERDVYTDIQFLRSLPSDIGIRPFAQTD